jgi:hypothetical protein
MFPYPLGVLTLLQGLYSLLWIVILMDVLSPTFDLRDISSWSAAQVGLLAVSLGMTTFAVGVVMQTVSRNTFRKMKDHWDTQVLTSPGIMQRLAEDDAYRPSGAPDLKDIEEAEGRARARKAGEFLHAADYALQIRAPHIHRSIQIYRDQYRLARGFVLPSLLLAIIVPFWEPLPRGHVGQFPLISLQFFFLGIFFAGICMYSFKERSHRYAAARIRAFWMLQREGQETSRKSAAHLSAVSGAN